MQILLHRSYNKAYTSLHMCKSCENCNVKHTYYGYKYNIWTYKVMTYGDEIWQFSLISISGNNSTSIILTFIINVRVSIFVQLHTHVLRVMCYIFHQTMFMCFSHYWNRKMHYRTRVRIFKCLKKPFKESFKTLSHCW